MIASRFYSANGVKWEARFFNKGDTFPEGRCEGAPTGGLGSTSRFRMGVCDLHG